MASFASSALKLKESFRPTAESEILKESRYLALRVAFKDLKTKYLLIKQENQLLKNKITKQNKSSMDSKSVLVELHKKLQNTQVDLHKQTDTCVKLQNELQSAKHNERMVIDENERLKKQIEQITALQQSDISKVYQRSLSGDVIFIPPERKSSSTEDRELQSGDVLTLSEKEKITKLEKQVNALITEKKQYMTHVHFLTSIIEKSRYSGNSNPSSPTGKESTQNLYNCVSLEEGNGIGSDIYVGSGSNKDELSGKLTGKKYLPIERLKKLKQNMIIARNLLQEDKRIADSIYQNAVQKVRHPNEPKSYCEWEDVGICSECMQKRKFFSKTNDIKQVSEDQSKSSGLNNFEDFERIIKTDVEVLSNQTIRDQNLTKSDISQGHIVSRTEPVVWDLSQEKQHSIARKSENNTGVQPVCTDNGREVPVVVLSEARVLGPPHYLPPLDVRRIPRRNENVLTDETNTVRSTDEITSSIAKDHLSSDPDGGPASLTDRGHLLTQPQLEMYRQTSLASSDSSSFEIISKESLRR